MAGGGLPGGERVFLDPHHQADITNASKKTVPMQVAGSAPQCGRRKGMATMLAAQTEKTE
jgi:hypothetical protein